MKHKFLLICLYILLLGVTWPVFSGWLTVFARYWVMFPAACVVAFLLGGFKLGSRAFLWMALYEVIVLLKELRTADDFSSSAQLIFVEFFMFTLLIMLPSVLNYSFSSRQSRVLLIIYCVFIVFTTISTFIINLIIPGIVRIIQSYINSGDTCPYDFLHRYGLMDYFLPHSISILIPPFVLWVKSAESSKFLRIVGVIMTVICFFMTFVSGATTPFLISSIIIVISFFLRQGAVKRNVRLFIVFGLLASILLNQTVIIWLLSVLDVLVGGEGEIHLKIIELQGAIIHDQSGGDLAVRQELYMKSITAFFSHILLGASENEIGQHAVLLDILGKTGLAGFIPYIMFVYYLLRKVYQMIPKKRRVFYISSVLVVLIMLGTKRMSAWPLWFNLIVISPMLLNYPVPRKEMKKYVRHE